MLPSMDYLSKEEMADEIKRELLPEYDHLTAVIKNCDDNVKNLQSKIDQELEKRFELESDKTQINNVLTIPAIFDVVVKERLFKKFKDHIERYRSNDQNKNKMYSSPPYKVKRNVQRTDKDGVSHVETRTVKVRDVRNNYEAVDRFNEYLDECKKIDIFNFTYDELGKEIDKLIRKAPRTDEYCEIFERDDILFE